MDSGQITVLISVIALLVSAVTASITMMHTGKRDRFNELDAICKQQWVELDALKETQAESVSRLGKSEKDREDLRIELKALRAKNVSDVVAIRGDIEVASAKVAENSAIARVAIINAETARNIAAKTADKNQTTLSEIAKTTEDTHRLLDKDRIAMLKHISSLARLYANDHPGDSIAQTTADKVDEALSKA